MGIFHLLIFICIILSYVKTCPNGAITSDSSPFCYRYFAAPTSFFDGEDTCKQYNGHLASITNAFINAFMKDTLKFISVDISSPVWVGGVLNGSNWTWTDEQPFSYNSWSKGEPSGKNCMGYVPSSGINTGCWYAKDCNNLYAFLCEVPNDSTTPTPPPSIHYCNDGWTHFNKTDSCYKVFYNQTWPDAENVCVGYKSHLTSIHSLEENLFIMNLAQSGMYLQACGVPMNGSSYMYDGTMIGLHFDSTTETWIWADGTIFDYNAWGPSRPQANSLYAHAIPDRCAGYENYFQLWSTNNPADISRTFVCKKSSNKS